MASRIALRLASLRDAMTVNDTKRCGRHADEHSIRYGSSTLEGRFDEAGTSIERQAPTGRCRGSSRSILRRARVVDLARAAQLRLHAPGRHPGPPPRWPQRSVPPEHVGGHRARDRRFRRARGRGADDEHAGDDASLPFDDVRWIAALDPPVIRDSLTFPLHMKQFGERLGRRRAEPTAVPDPGLLQRLDRRGLRPRRGDPYPSFASRSTTSSSSGSSSAAQGRNLDPRTGTGRCSSA